MLMVTVRMMMVVVMVVMVVVMMTTFYQSFRIDSSRGRVGSSYVCFQRTLPHTQLTPPRTHPPHPAPSPAPLLFLSLCRGDHRAVLAHQPDVPPPWGLPPLLRL